MVGMIYAGYLWCCFDWMIDWLIIYLLFLSYVPTRDEAQSKMAALAERSEKDQKQHDAEMKDLLRTISNDNKIKTFMKQKANDRHEFKAEEAAKKKSQCLLCIPADKGSSI